MIFVDDWVDSLVCGKFTELCVCVHAYKRVCVFMFLSLKADVNNLCHQSHLYSQI